MKDDGSVGRELADGQRCVGSGFANHVCRVANEVRKQWGVSTYHDPLSHSRYVCDGRSHVFEQRLFKKGMFGKTAFVCYGDTKPDNT